MATKSLMIARCAELEEFVDDGVFRRYVVEYTHEGDNYMWFVSACSFKDAEERLVSMVASGNVAGVVEYEVDQDPCKN